ncbi:hypothetical protein L1987_54754 [Smallanthus sonchifolius]|uniref:Uncharacterized protein n=1 Tax=Smallanthus sonchifolius TaxID=185202 RepID=A0ACB9E926_9ASTR|nr:hypothetical protein L1987_54754 [Smallanthus sonchifolius]
MKLSRYCFHFECKERVSSWLCLLEFDRVYGPACFGSFVTHSVGGFMYLSMDQKAYVRLFKTVKITYS